jgi:DNA-directed RNA polymerase subunit RPC12/RpoP
MAPVYPQQGSEAVPLRPTPRHGVPLDDEDIGVSCPLCGSRLYVRRRQIGDTVACPDCHSPVLVTEPTKRKQTQPTEYDEADLFKLEAPIDRPAVYVPETGVGSPLPSATPGTRSRVGAGSPVGGGTAMQQAARTLLEKARAAQEAEQADERERSAERFAAGLFGFFADPPALVRLVILAVWFAVGVTLFRWTTGLKISESLPAIFSEAGSLVLAVATIFIGITFLIGVAACGQALVRDSSEGLRKIEHWPGLNFRDWWRGTCYIMIAGFLAALPGAGVGFVLGWVGLTGTLLYTAAASFVGLFPPLLLSMLEANSMWTFFHREVWASIHERPDPWTLTYLMTAVIAGGGVFAFSFGLAGGFSVGLVAALLLVALMMLYFRTVGRLIAFLAGREEKSNAKT